MAKYRALTIEELEAMKEDFIHYLAAQSITGEEWESIKAETPEKAERVIELFSDVVFEKILRSTMFLVHSTPTHLKAFQCLADKMVMMGIDVADPASGQIIPVDITEASAGDFKAYTAEKAYTKTRELEMFDLIMSGAQPSDGATYKAIGMVLPDLL